MQVEPFVTASQEIMGAPKRMWLTECQKATGGKPDTVTLALAHGERTQKVSNVEPAVGGGCGPT